MTKIAYIAGAVTGLDQQWVFEVFERKEQELIAKGYIVYNPVKLVLNNPKLIGAEWSVIMRYVVPYLLMSDELHLIDGWQHSKGANKEREHARDYEIPIVYP